MPLLTWDNLCKRLPDEFMVSVASSLDKLQFDVE